MNKNIHSNSTIILDLDHTLIHSIRLTYTLKEDHYDNTQCLKFNTNSDEYITFKRSYANEFLRYCFNKYDNVVIWSAGTSDYVHEILHKLFGEYVFDLILTRDHCVDFMKDFNQNRIKILFNECGIRIFDDEHTSIFIDDKVDRIQNRPRNLKLIEAPPFHSKWLTPINRRQKRRRPIREQDLYLMKLRHELSLK